jgi:transposase InsO family protein
MSMSKLAAAGLTGTYSDKEITICTSDGHQIGTAVANQGLYHIALAETPSDTAVQQPIASLTDLEDQVWLWHRRLGHLSLDRLGKLLKMSTGIEITAEQIKQKIKSVCPVCATSRAIVKIPKEPATRRATEFGALFHADGWGPYSIQGLDGTTKFVFVTDDASRNLYCLRIAKKSDAPDALKQFTKTVEKKHDITVRSWRVDNEFFKGPFKEWCERKGMTIEPTAPYAHHQVGVAERRNRVIREGAAAMINENTLSGQLACITIGKADRMMRSTNLPADLWPEAVDHAVWLANRTPTKALKDKTPWEFVMKEKPDLSKEKVWGSRVYVSLTAEQTHGKPKLHTDRAWLGYFVGMDNESTYRVYYPDQNQVKRVAFARVDEREGQDDPFPRSGMDIEEPLLDGGEVASEDDDNDSQNDITPLTANMVDTGDNEFGSDIDIEDSLAVQLETRATGGDTEMDGNATNDDSLHHDEAQQSRRLCADDGTEMNEHSPYWLTQSDDAMGEDSPSEFDDPSGNDEEDEEYSVATPPRKRQQRVHTRLQGQITRKSPSSGSDRSTQGRMIPSTQDAPTRVQRKTTTRKPNVKVSDEVLLALYNEGLKPTDIMEKTGISNTSYYKKRKELGLTGKKVSDEGFLVLHNEGLTIKEMMAKTGYASYTHIAAKLTAFGVEPHGRLPSVREKSARITAALDLKEVAADFAAGVTTTDVAKKNGISFEALANHCRIAGIELPKAYTHWTPDERALLQQLYEQGANCREMAATLGRSKKSIRMQRFDLKLWRADQPVKTSCSMCKKRRRRFLCDGYGEKPCTYCVERGCTTCSYSSPDGGSVKIVFILKDTQFASDKFDPDYTDQGECLRCRHTGRTCIRPDSNHPCTACMTSKNVKSACSVPLRKGVEKRFWRAAFIYEEDDLAESYTITLREPEFFKLRKDRISQLHKDAFYAQESRLFKGTYVSDSEPGDIDDFSDDATSESEEDVPEGAFEASRSTIQGFAHAQAHMASLDWDEEAFLAEMEAIDLAAPSEAHMASLDWDEEAFLVEMEALDLVAMSAFAVIHDFAHAPVPTTRRQALAGPEASEWHVAIQLEYDSMRQTHTWEPSALPPGRKALTMRWVFKRKLSPTGAVARYKARIVVRGFQQVQGFDYNETYSGVVKDSSTRVLFAIAAALGWHVHQMDVETAFLNSELQEEIYVHAPEGYAHHGKILKLLRAVYGLKQAPRYWYKKFRAWLIDVGFTVVPQDECVFMSKDRKLIISLYVDDLNIFGPNIASIEEFKTEIAAAFKMTDAGPASWYLGMQVDQTADGISMHQGAYARQIINQHHFTNAAPTSTPLDVKAKLTKFDETAFDDDRKKYQSMTGALNWLAVKTRPDLSFPTSLVSRYNANPGPQHHDTVSHVFRYLNSEPDKGIKYDRLTDGQELKLDGYVDSDWAGDKDTSLSTTGYVFTLAGGPVTWSSQKQKNVATSTTHAEYFAASESAKEAYWLRSFMNEIAVLDGRIHQDTVPLHIDNNSAFKLTKNPESHARTRHIDIRYHYIRELVEDGIIAPEWIPGKDNPADMFTKALTAPLLQIICHTLGIMVR